MFSENEELKRIQECCLESLQEIIKICDKNNLAYYLCGGTLLGAIRYNGFIPWDNDIDIIMPRQDFENFIKIASSELPQGIILKHYSICKTKDEINAENAQVINKNYAFLRHWTKNKKEINPWIDIFVLDNMPNNSIVRNIIFYKYKILQKIFQLSISDQIINVSKKRNIFERIIIKITDIFNPFQKKDPFIILKIMNKIAIKNYCDFSSIYVCNFSGTYGRKEIMMSDYYKKSIKVDFEGIKCNIPARYDKILKSLYGDYLKEKKIIVH